RAPVGSGLRILHPPTRSAPPLISPHPHLFFLLTRPPPRSTLFPYTTLFRSLSLQAKPRGTDVAEWLLVSTTRAPRCVPRSRFRRSEEHTSELQSRENLVCRLLLEKKNFISGANLTACANTPALTTPREERPP